MKDRDSSLEHFVKAQDGVYEVALAEIRAGSKRSHWMWFIFPQLAGLGHSAMAVRYAINSETQALTYLAHPILGYRYRACVSALEGLTDTTVETVFGPLDAMKLRSSLTLFAEASDDSQIVPALDRWFGAKDRATLRLLGRD